MSGFSIARKVYKDYSSKEGNQHIASEYNLYHILNYCKMINAKKILELGTGIGTILSLFQESKKQGFYSPQYYIGTENNEFCLGEIEKNCLKNPPTDLPVSIVGNANTVTETGFDFVVLDGKEPFLRKVICELLSKHAILITEGYRADQVQEIVGILKEKGIPFSNFLRFSTWKNPNYGPFNQPFQAGHTVFFIHPTESEKKFCENMTKYARVRSVARKILNLRKIKTIVS